MELQRTPSISFILIIALLMSLVSISINMILPAFDAMRKTFNPPNPNQIQSVVSFLYLGLGIGQLFYGPFSDWVGRKRAIYLGLFIFILGCLISFSAQNLSFLILGQLIQGLGLGAPRVICLSIIRDRFEGAFMARTLSFILVIYTLSPVVSPLFGKWFLNFVDWPVLFLVFSGFTIVILVLFHFFIQETLTIERRKLFELKSILKNTRHVLSNKFTMGYILLLGIYSGVFITYLNLSQEIFEFSYKLGDRYPLIFALLALAIGTASFVNGKLVIKHGMERMVLRSVQISFSASILFLILNLIGNTAFPLFFVFIFIVLFSYGILIGNISALAIAPFKHIAGLGAAIIGAVSTLISVPISLFIGSFYSGSTLPITIGFLGAGCIALFILNKLKKVN